MFTYYQAENSTAEPALVNAIEQGLRAEHGVVTEDDILMELTKWVEASDNDILSDIYQQTINYVVSGQRKGYKANAVFLFLVPCHSLFFEYPSLGAFIVFALPPGRRPQV